MATYWEYYFFDDLNSFEPLGTPKTPKKNKNINFSDLKIGPGALKLPLKYFLLVFGKKNFCRPLPYVGKVSDLGLKVKWLRLNGRTVQPPLNPLYFGVFIMFWVGSLIIQYGRFYIQVFLGHRVEKKLKNLIIKKS